MGARAAEKCAYLPIAEHGVIGDLHSVALVGVDATIDWYCCPRFDSPSIFGAILDARRGGRFAIRPTGRESTSKQLYLPDTNVLITRFLSRDGVAEVEDFMPISGAPGRAHRQRLIRRVQCVRGRLRFEVEVEPRFDYGRTRHETEMDDGCVVFRTPSLAMVLTTAVELAQTRGGGVRGRFELAEGESVTFVFGQLDARARRRPYDEAETRRLFEETIRFWRQWLSRSRYAGRWREMVNRSALVLKLLTYAPTGAIVAAPTTSLPERLGGSRNWDYRYTWIRDAAFSLYGLLRLGFTEEAAAFMDWLTDRVQEPWDGGSGPLQIMYRVDGSADLDEEILDHWEGYAGSSPVRIGNGAASQLQLDIYGELIDSVYLYNKYGTPLYHDAWVDIRGMVDWLTQNWDRADEGIWETRGGSKRFTYSRLMTWVAVERAIRIARQRGLPADLVRWLAVRDEIYDWVMTCGWSERRKAFVQHDEGDVLDASLLLMPLVKFISPTDPRWLSTLDAISAELVADSLVYRYDPIAAPDGVGGAEGTFSICSFWYVEALARAGRLDEARLVFEKALTYANHLGLYAEELGPTGEQLGNFPQAFTHLALISAAFNLDRQLG